MLNREEIKNLIESEKLIEGYINLDKQLTPNGFDLTVGEVFEFASGGQLDFSNSERIIPAARKITSEKIKPADKFGWWNLRPGAYKVKTNETVNLPDNLIGLGFSRTSLLRMGAFTQHGVWDAGFKGKGEFIIKVENKEGIGLKENCRIAQLVFFRVKTTAGYDGIYKHLK